VSYTDSVKKKVFERMISERNRIAERYRSEGEGQSAKILGMKQKELQKIESEAYKKVQDIKGLADATATNIYAAAHNQDPQLYKLLKSLESYKTTLDKKSTIILSTESDYLNPLTKMAQ
ncbi:MAG: protease modulator HflC, partial [Myxococcota bacterium]|nr:protease modulator HflC [Myxococcota bacterium]